jgi:LDH2 family malate/lactate/ureidoglycolate dehydrogenase
MGPAGHGHRRCEPVTITVPEAALRAQIEGVLAAWGMAPELITPTADVMTDTDLAGIDSHGISMLPYYETILARGELDLTAHPAVVRDTAVTALVDARSGLGHPAGVMGMRLAVEKALQVGVGVVSVANSHHFGAAGYYARMATDRGLIGFAASSGRTVCVLPTGAAVPRLSTNPLAFAAPARRNGPFLLDMATSTVAANKVKVYGFDGAPLPPGWVLDDSGKPVVEATAALDYIYDRDAGGLTPLGGTAEMSSHKGYGLNMMVQILAATLSGGSFAPIRELGDDEPDNIGHFFLAIDPAAFRQQGEFEDDLDAAMDVLRDTPPVDPARPVLVPGDPESTARQQRRRDGIPLTWALVVQIRALCTRSAAPFLLE